MTFWRLLGEGLVLESRKSSVKGVLKIMSIDNTRCWARMFHGFHGCQWCGWSDVGNIESAGGGEQQQKEDWQNVMMMMMMTSDDEDEEEDSLTETHCFTKLK